MNVPSAMSGISVRHRLLTKILRRSRLMPMRCRPPVLANLLLVPFVRIFLLPGPCVRVFLTPGPFVRIFLLPGPCVRVLLPLGTCVRVLLPLGTCVRVLLPVGTCVTVFLTTGVIGLVDFTTLRVVTVGRETLFIVGRETLRTTGLVCTTVRAGADRTTGATFFFCSAVRVVVEPASLDAGAVCAIARDDVCTAAATAKAAIKMISLRISAPFLVRFSVGPAARARTTNVHGGERMFIQILFFEYDLHQIGAFVAPPVDRVRVSNWSSICFLNGEMKSGHPYAGTPDAPAGGGAGWLSPPATIKWKALFWHWVGGGY